MKNLLFAALLLASLGIAVPTLAQDTPAPSPTAEFSQKVGLTDIAVVYSRPGMKGRTIYAEDGLVPFGEIWRTGANQATKFSFGGKVMIGDATLEAGDYAVLTKPGQDEWEVMFFSFEGAGWGGYRKKTPVVTVKVAPMKIDPAVETFTIDIQNVRDESATINFIWETTEVAVPFKVEKTW